MPLVGVQCDRAKAMASLGFRPIDAIAFLFFRTFLFEKERSLWKLFLITLAVWYSTSVL